jgi:hypothetical protein
MADSLPHVAGNSAVRMSKRRIPDWTPCGYCFNEWATVWDHLQPWSKFGLSKAKNLYPSCGRCNRMLYDFSFASIEEKREYARTTLIERGDWNPIMEGAAFMPDVQEAFSEVAEVAEILQSSVPEARVGGRSKKHGGVPDLPKAIRKKKTASGVLQSKVPLDGVAKSKSGKYALKKRVCRMCKQLFKPTQRKQPYCDMVCQYHAVGNERIEKRIANLIPEQIKQQLAFLSDRIDQQVSSMTGIERSCSTCKGRRVSSAGGECRACHGWGMVLTTLGQSILTMLNRRYLR